ncbi:hypothetical protein ACQ4PT_059604 [Festuca glaucescens]
MGASDVQPESNLQLAPVQPRDAEHESASSGANPTPIMEDDEAIDEEDEPTQADLGALEHDPGKQIPISRYAVNDQDRIAHLLNALGVSCKKMRLLRIAQAEELIDALELEEVETWIGQNEEMGLGRPCDTRWGSHFRTVNRVLSMYAAIRRVLLKIGKEYHGAEAQAALSVLTSFRSFEFVFMAHLMQEIFGYTDDLSRALQMKEQDIVHAIELVDLTKYHLEGLRSDPR